VKLSLNIAPDASEMIARRARGTPRVANRLLRRVRDFAQVKTKSSNIGVEIVLQAMESLGIDDLGLDDSDRRLLKVVAEYYGGGPVGIEALAATLNEEVDTLVDVVEPYLLKSGLLKRTSRGRELTKTGAAHIQFSGDQKQQKLF